MKLEFVKDSGRVKLEKDPVVLKRGDVVDVTENFGKHLLKTNKDFKRVTEKSKKKLKEVEK